MNDLKHKRDDMYCWRCKNWITSAFRETEVAGAYRAVLCLDCRNDWTLFFREHPLLLEATKNQIAQYSLQQQTMGDGLDRSADVAAIVEAKFELNKRIFFLAENWVENIIERPEPPKAPARQLTPEEIKEIERAQIEGPKKRLASLES